MSNEVVTLNISWDQVKQIIRNLIREKRAEKKAPSIIKIFFKKYHIEYVSGKVFINKIEIYDYYHTANSPRLEIELLEEKDNVTLLKVKSRLTLNHYWVIFVLSLFIIGSVIAAVINYSENQIDFKEWLVFSTVFLIQLSIYIYYCFISADELYKYFIAQMNYHIKSNTPPLK